MDTEQTINVKKPKAEKPLGSRAYGSIPHLPGSRLGPADRTINAGQASICTVKERPGDRVVVQEKLDGSCCAIARTDDGQLHALRRTGYPAATSPFAQHHLFAEWVRINADRFDPLQPGHRLVGEWIAQAHGTRYETTTPFVVFDWMTGQRRHTVVELMGMAAWCGLPTPMLLHEGQALPLDQALDKLGTHGHHGAIDPAEGVVYRVERGFQVLFLAKYVRPDKVDGCYLPELTGGEPVWNWNPSVS